MADQKRPWFSSLTHVAHMVNIQLSKDEQPDFTFADVYAGLEKGDLFKKLEERIPGFDHWGLLTKSDGFQPELLMETLGEAAEFYRGKEHNKLGIANEDAGLSLLLALVLLALDEKMWDQTEAADRPKGFRRN